MFGNIVFIPENSGVEDDIMQFIISGMFLPFPRLPREKGENLGRLPGGGVA